MTAGDELPVTESFPGSGGLIASSTEGRLDVEVFERFFGDLIRRRYVGEEAIKAPLPSWTSSSRNTSPYHSRGGSLHDDDFDNSYNSVNGQSARYNTPVPTQVTLLPPPFAYPQQPLGTSEMHLTTRSNSMGKSSSSWSFDANLRL
ncbi:hypothetical protein L7F22_059917 [Adiantum nelumboides]|nr:hypothetical protein [Adiantum nelumboides]